LNININVLNVLLYKRRKKKHSKKEYLRLLFEKKKTWRNGGKNQYGVTQEKPSYKCIIKSNNKLCYYY
jgi:hypothetical protein